MWFSNKFTGNSDYRPEIAEGLFERSLTMWVFSLFYSSRQPTKQTHPLQKSLMHFSVSFCRITIVLMASWRYIRVIKAWRKLFAGIMNKLGCISQIRTVNTLFHHALRTILNGSLLLRNTLLCADPIKIIPIASIYLVSAVLFHSTRQIN